MATDPAERLRRHRLRADAALEIGRGDLAEREARAAITVAPDDAVAYLQLARSLLLRERAAEALEATSRALSLAPSWAYAHYLHAFVLQYQNRHADALGSLREAVSREPRSATYRVRLAVALAETRAVDEARASLALALELAPDDFTTLADAARIGVTLGDHAAAVAHARRAVTIDPARIVGYWRLARALNASRAFDEAAEVARSALVLDPNDVVSWTELAAATGARGSVRASLAAHGQAARLAGHRADLTGNYVAALVAEKQLARARRVLRLARVQHADHARLIAQERSVTAALWSRRVDRATSAVLRALFFVASLYGAATADGWPAALVSLAFALVWVVLLWRSIATGIEDDPPVRERVTR